MNMELKFSYSKFLIVIIEKHIQLKIISLLLDLRSDIITECSSSLECLNTIVDNINTSQATHFAPSTSSKKSVSPQ